MFTRFQTFVESMPEWVSLLIVAVAMLFMAYGATELSPFEMYDMF